MAVDTFGQLGRLRRAAGDRGPSAGCGWWRTPPAPPGRRTRAARPAASADARLLQLPRPQGHHRRRRRRADHRPRRTCDARPQAHNFGIESALSRAGLDGLPVPSSTRSATTTSSPTSPRPSCWPSWTGSPDLVTARARASPTRYGDLLGDFELVDAAGGRAPDRTHSWQSYVAHPRPRASTAARSPWRCAAAACSATSAPTPPTCSRSTARRSPCPVSADLFPRHLAIPMHANLTEAQVERVAAAVREVVRHRALTRCPPSRPRPRKEYLHVHRLLHRRGRLHRLPRRAHAARAGRQGPPVRQHVPRRPRQGRRAGRAPATSSSSTRTSATAAPSTRP